MGVIDRLPIVPLMLGILLGSLGAIVLYGFVLPQLGRWRQKQSGAKLEERPRTLRMKGRSVRRFTHNPQLLAGALIVLAFAAVAVGAPLIAPPAEGDPYLMPSDTFGFTPQPPSAEHPLGTTQSQADIFYGLVWGTRVAFKLSLVVALGRTILGVIVGLISGYYGDLIDGVLMRITDAFLAFPIMAAVLVMLTFFAGGWLGIQAGGVDRIIVLALILFGWMRYARLTRGNVLAAREEQYVEAAISVGARNRRIIFRHILPNASHGLFVLVASDLGAVVVWAAVFSFMGLSGSEALADWGQMLNFSRDWIIGTAANAFEFWYTYLPPSLAIVFFSVGWNLVGDGLREVLDPRQWTATHG
jgi:peptide/nickel transport system permease protein